MIGYVTLGTKDLPRAVKFYDDLLGPLGAKRVMDLGRGHAWSAGPGQPMLLVMTPFDQQPAGCGNGPMTALVCSNRAQVDECHARALALGGTDEGPTGERMPGFYAGYFRDLDGNKLNFFHMG
jgi:catechol 2,3-dioxygenase-like lactoylglutathione lyase family enzyme